MLMIERKLKGIKLYWIFIVVTILALSVVIIEAITFVRYSSIKKELATAESIGSRMIYDYITIEKTALCSEEDFMRFCKIRYGLSGITFKHTGDKSSGQENILLCKVLNESLDSNFIFYLGFEEYLFEEIGSVVFATTSYSDVFQEIKKKNKEVDKIIIGDVLEIYGNNEFPDESCKYIPIYGNEPEKFGVFVSIIEGDFQIEMIQANCQIDKACIKDIVTKLEFALKEYLSINGKTTLKDAFISLYFMC